MQFPASKLFIYKSGAHARCVQMEHAGCSPPQPLETLQLSKYICINTSVIICSVEKFHVQRALAPLFLIMLAAASADTLHVPCCIYFCSIICLFNWTPACLIRNKAESWGKYFIPFDLMSSFRCLFSAVHRVHI